MLKSQLLHPDILRSLGTAGHGAQVLIADGNYPFNIGAPLAADRVFLNFAPGLINATDTLKVLATAIPVESATVMLQQDGNEAPIIAEFRDLLVDVPFETLERFAFYDAVKKPETSLVIATAEQRIYANILLTIGVVPPA